MSPPSALSSHHATSESVYTELWSSLASLLRSYTAAHGLHSGRYATVEVSAGTILVRVGEQQLLLSHTAGEGFAQRNGANPIPFVLTLEGAIRSRGQLEEIDIFAERLAREIMQ